MGQFSWIMSDINEPVYNDWGKQPAYLLIPEEFQDWYEGKKYFREDDYEGYGEFDGRDAYALVAQWNFPDKCKNPDGSWKTDDECRMLGIDIACDNNSDLKYPIKITAQPMAYKNAEPSDNDPNQGWHTEDEYGEESR